MEVGEKERSPLAVVSSAMAPGRAQDVEGGRDRGDDHRRGRREDAPGPPPVERQDRRAGGDGALSEQHAGDHKAGDDEEDVYSDISTPETGDPGVIEDDQKDRHGP